MEPLRVSARQEAEVTAPSCGLSVFTLSVGIVMGAGVLFPAGAREFSLHTVQTGCGVHPTSYTMRTGISFPGDKVAGA
jgi:hypothetical protein